METLNQEQKTFLQNLAYGLSTPPRTPILRTPADYDMEYEEVEFTTEDGVTIKAWYIPANSDKYVISNHFSPGNRYGFAGHLEGLDFAGGFEVNFLPRYKALHDAGYNVITYDIRCHGESPEGPEKVTGVGYYEWRDVLGSIRYVRDRFGEDCNLSLISMCMGANATINAMEKDPQAFENIKCWISIQPLKGRTTIERSCEAMNIPTEEGLETFEPIYNQITGLKVSDHNITQKAKFIKIPTFFLQVRNDMSSRASDVQGMFDDTSVEDKKIFFIEDTPWRFHGYTYFSEHPEQMIDWLDRHTN